MKMFGLCKSDAVSGASPSLNFYHELTQSHLLKFAKKESLDFIHWIIFSNHCSINLRLCNHDQLTCYSHQGSCVITASILSVLVCAHTLDLCVILCFVLLAFDGQLHTIAR